MINEGRHFLTAMLKERVLPFFTGRDARDLETMIDESTSTSGTTSMPGRRSG